MRDLTLLSALGQTQGRRRIPMSATMTDKVRTTEACKPNKDSLFTYYTTVDEGGGAGEHSSQGKRSTGRDNN